MQAECCSLQANQQRLRGRRQKQKIVLPPLLPKWRPLYLDTKRTSNQLLIRTIEGYEQALEKGGQARADNPTSGLGNLLDEKSKPETLPHPSNREELFGISGYAFVHLPRDENKKDSMAQIALSGLQGYLSGELGGADHHQNKSRSTGKEWSVPQQIVQQ
jgi:hypothetical protein